jgi:hypothetical protein
MSEIEPITNEVLEDSEVKLGVIESHEPAPTKKENIDTNVLSGDNQVDVEIEPDVKGNITRIQLCSCTFILNCFTNNSVAKN